MMTDTSKAEVSGPLPPKGVFFGVLLSVGFMFTDYSLINLPVFVPGLRIPGTHWDWSGNGMSLAFCWLVLACSPWLRQNVGLRCQQANGSLLISFICLSFCFGSSIGGGFRLAPVSFSLE